MRLGAELLDHKQLEQPLLSVRSLRLVVEGCVKDGAFAVLCVRHDREPSMLAAFRRGEKSLGRSSSQNSPRPHVELDLNPTAQDVPELGVVHIRCDLAPTARVPPEIEDARKRLSNQIVSVI